MAFISGIFDGAATLGLTELLSQNNEGKSSVLESSSTAANAQRLVDAHTAGKKSRTAYGISAGSDLGQQALKRALAEMSPGGGPITFADIAAYQKKLEEDFTFQMRQALEEMRLPPETVFSLNLSADGVVGVVSDDPIVKTRLEGYLEDNPEAREQFAYIQALANLERARQSPAGALAVWQGVRSDMAQMRTEVLEDFFSDALGAGMQYTALLANFSPLASGQYAQSAGFYAGISYTV
jgi:hypothetical protein